MNNFINEYGDWDEEVLYDDDEEDLNFRNLEESHIIFKGKPFTILSKYLQSIIDPMELAVINLLVDQYGFISTESPKYLKNGDYFLCTSKWLRLKVRLSESDEKRIMKKFFNQEIISKDTNSVFQSRYIRINFLKLSEYFKKCQKEYALQLEREKELEALRIQRRRLKRGD